MLCKCSSNLCRNKCNSEVSQSLADGHTNVICVCHTEVTSYKHRFWPCLYSWPAYQHFPLWCSQGQQLGFFLPCIYLYAVGVWCHLQSAYLQPQSNSAVCKSLWFIYVPLKIFCLAQKSLVVQSQQKKRFLIHTFQGWPGGFHSITLRL